MGIAVEHLIGWVLGRVEVEETIMVDRCGRYDVGVGREGVDDFWMRNVER